jgi:hypothetical protein
MTINEYIALKKKADDVWCDFTCMEIKQKILRFNNETKT